MKNISLNQYEFCDNKTNQGPGFHKINCKHWEIKRGNSRYDCSQYCKLKSSSTNKNICQKCDKIDPIVEEVKIDLNSPASQIRSTMPQFNFFKTQAQPQSQNFNEQVKSYASAESSQFIQGKVSQEVFDKRKQHCLNCHLRKNVNPKVDEIGWCGGCGCSSTNPRAGLSQKLWMPSLKCPLNKFGEEKGEGFNLKDAKDTVTGVIQSVTDLLKNKSDQS